MKKTIPEHEVEVCDLCAEGAGTWLKKCELCGKTYCRSCQGVFVASYVNPPICERCKTKGMIKICDEYADKINELIKERDRLILYKEI